MLLDAQVEVELWPEAMKTAAYLRNRFPISALDQMIPYEAWFGRKPSLAHLRPFGCPSYAYIPPALTKKFDSRTRRCILLGYVHETNKIWHLYDPVRKHICDCSSVTFAEDEMPPIRAVLQQQHLPALQNSMLKAQLSKLQLLIPAQYPMPKAQQLSKLQLSIPAQNPTLKVQSVEPHLSQQYSPAPYQMPMLQLPKQQ